MLVRSSIVFKLMLCIIPLEAVPTMMTFVAHAGNVSLTG